MPSNKIKILRLSLYCILFSLIVPFSSIAAENREVKMGIFPFSPMNFIDETGKPSGIYIDIIEYIAQKEGWSVTYVSGTWDEGLSRVKNGEIDLLPSIAFSEERDRLIDYNHESVVTVWGMVYVRPGSGVKNILDLEGKTIAIMKGDISGVNFRKTIEQFDIECSFIECQSHYDVLQQVEEEKAFGGVVPNIFGLMNSGKYNLVESSIIFSPFAIYFGAPEGEDTLITTVDSYLLKWKADKNSFYYETLNYWLAGEHFKKNVIPKWLLFSILLSVCIA